MLFPGDYAIPVNQVQTSAIYDKIWNPTFNGHFLPPITGGRLLIRRLSLTMDKTGANNPAYVAFALGKPDGSTSAWLSMIYKKSEFYSSSSQSVNLLLQENEGVKYYFTSAGGDTILHSGIVVYQEKYDD